MVAINDLIKINDYEWLIPRTFRKDMKVSVRIFSSQRLLENVMDDNSLEQAVNSASLPGLVGEVMVMPDMHQGYGFPIGGVAATRYPEGVISPGGIGYDINCGVRLLGSHIAYHDVLPYMDQLANALDQYCPSGVGEKGDFRVNGDELEQVCKEGANWCLKRGYASGTDIRRTEDEGRLEGADPSKVSKRAKERGMPQLGTLGAGNHFLEIDVVDQVFDLRSSNTMGLTEGNIVLQIHCGSRGFGHQICSDYVEEFQSVIQRFGINLPDRELVCAPLDSPEGRNYLAAMRCAANYAFANRQILAYQARRAFESILAGKIKNWDLHQVYDIAHNIGKIETHLIDGQKMKVCVHRKGATRAFGPESEEIPEEYRAIGQPVLVPGSMGTASWVLVGTETSMLKSFGSTCHGAGRVMSRHQAKKTIRGERLRKELEDDGIVLRFGSIGGIAEEAPQAYKDVDAVVEIVTGAKLARKVARLRPLAVIKG